MSIIRSHFGSSRCWTSAPQRLESKWSSHLGQSYAKVATSRVPCCLSRWFLGRVYGIMATVVNENGRSCGALTAVILGLMCVTLQGAVLRSAQDVVALGHDSMESPLLLLDPPMRSKTRWESELFWNTNDRWCVQPWVLMKSRMSLSSKLHSRNSLRNMPKWKNDRRTWQSASLTHRKSWIRSAKSWRNCQLRNARSRLSAAGCNHTAAETKEVEQAPPDNLTEDRKKFWIDKQSQASEAKRALQELATHSMTKRRCTSKTQQPEHIDVEPPEPIQCPSQEPQVGKMEPSDIKNLIAPADRTAGLANEAASRAFRDEAT